MTERKYTDAEYMDAFETIGSLTGAAKSLGVDRNTLRKHIRRLQLGNYVPPTFEPTRVTTGAQGQILSVQSKPEGEPTDHMPLVPDGHRLTGVTTLVGSDGRVSSQHIMSRVDRGTVDPEALLKAMTEHLESYRGIAEPTWPLVQCLRPDLLNVYGFGDPHLGLLAWARESGANFDLKIACQDLLTGLDLMVQKAPRATTGLLLDIGDFFHAEDDKQQTPGAGNKLDVDGRHNKTLEAGVDTLRRMVDRLRQVHEKVIVVIVPGNHDPNGARAIRLMLQIAYERDDNVTVLDNVSPFIYYRFHSNFFLFHHGNKPKGIFKPEELAEIMLHDRPRDTGECDNRFIWAGHVHHKNVWMSDHRNFVYETLQSLCAPDLWHRSSGYRSQRACEAITYHAEFGYTGRHRVTKGEIDASR